MPKIYQILTVDVNGTFKYYVCLRKPLITFVWDKIVAAIFYVLFFCVAFFRGCGKEFVKQAPIVLDQAGWQKIGEFLSSEEAHDAIHSISHQQPYNVIRQSSGDRL